MKTLQKWLEKRKFAVHLAAFALIILPSAVLYFAAQQGAQGWTWALLALVAAGNLLAISVS